MLLLPAGLAILLAVFVTGSFRHTEEFTPPPAPEVLPLTDPLAGIPGGVASLPVRPMPASYMCGPDALRNILHRWGDPVSAERLAELAHTTPERGTSLLGLREAAMSRGVFTTGVELDYAALEKQVGRHGVEIITHVEPEHYFWVRHVNAGGVAVQDEASPASRWMKRAEFEAMWTGKALLLLRPGDRRARAR